MGRHSIRFLFLLLLSPFSYPSPEEPECLRVMRAAIGDTTAGELATRFYQQLLEKGRRPEGTGMGQIPRLAQMLQLGAETLIVLNDPQLDPMLYAWLQDVRSRYSGIETLFDRAQQIAVFVDNTFRYRTGGFFRPWRHYRYSQLIHRSSYARLGNFLAEGLGESRHMAVSLQLALQELNVPSQIIYGTVAIGTTVHSRPWNVVEAPNGNGFILDPFSRVYGITPYPFSLTAIDSRESTLTEGASIYCYRPRDLDSYVGPHDLTRDLFEDLWPLLFP